MNLFQERRVGDTYCEAGGGSRKGCSMGLLAIEGGDSGARVVLFFRLNGDQET